VTRSVRSLVAVLLAAFLVVSCGGGTGNGTDQTEDGDQIPEDGERVVVNFGHVPSISSSEKLTQLEPLKEYLESELPVQIQIQFAEDYSTVIERVNRGEYDFVTFGPLSYVEAEQQGDIVASLMPVRFGNTHYRSLIITNTNSGVDEVGDLEGKQFAFVDRKSTSGYLFPSAYLKKNGVDPEEDLGGYSFMGSHSNVVVGVWLERYAAGAIYDDARQAHDQAERIMEETKVIARTDKIPNEPWAFRKGFREKHPELVKQMRQLLLDLDTSGPAQKRILDSLGIDGFAPAEDSDYDVVREYQQTLKN
jgi:phosphonate transport system substrate-binding protein